MDAPLQLQPPHTHDDQGELRRVGVEIEVLGLTIERASDILIELFGGQAVKDSEYQMKVVETALGKFGVEVDSSPLKAIAKKRKRRRVIGAWDQIREKFFGTVAEYVTPTEIVTAPLLPEDLIEMDRLTEVLRRAGAVGTEASVAYGIGVHLNPTVPSSGARVLRDHIRAFVLLYPWLVRVLHPNISRRFLRFIAPYPASYARLVLDPSYAPSLPELIDDYLRHNPTRNRGLDLLPLFAHLDRTRVERVIDDKRVSARPTFHFRMPDSRVDDPCFRITDQWRAWLEVERLAADTPRLERLSRGAFDALRSPWAMLRRRPFFVQPAQGALP
jgi:hypothetical protein